MKKVYVCFSFVYVKLDIDTTLDNKIYSSSVDDLQFFVMNQDSDRDEFEKQETHFYKDICHFETMRSYEYRSYEDDDEIDIEKYNECVLSLISEIRKLEKSTDNYSVHDLI